MKNIICFLFSLLVFIGCTHPTNLEAEKKVHEYLQNKQYFKLRDFLSGNKQFLSEKSLLTAQAFTCNVFNKNKQSNSNIDDLIHKYNNELSDSVNTELLCK